MSYEYQTGQPSTEGGSVASTAKDEAAGVARSAAQSGQHLAGEAKAQAAEVGREAGRQAKDVLAQGRTQLADQAAAQKSKLTGTVRSFSEELNAMASGNPSEPGLASDVARQVSQRVDGLATWLENAEPAVILEDVKNFARRRPGLFLAIAAGTGLVAGRLTRSLKDVSSSDSDGQGAAQIGGGTYGATYGTGPVYGETTSSGTGAEYATVTSASLAAAGTAAGAPTAGVESGYSSGYATEGSTEETLAFAAPVDTYSTGTGTDALGGTYGGSTYGDTGGTDALGGTYDEGTGTDALGGTYGETAGLGDTTGYGETTSYDTGETTSYDAGTSQADDLAWPPVHGEGEQR